MIVGVTSPLRRIVCGCVWRCRSERECYIKITVAGVMKLMLVKLKEMLQRRGIRSQLELAKMAGLSPNTISAIGQGRGRIETIGKLCNALNCQPGDLMEYIPDED